MYRQDRILLVNPRYKPDWDLPGGMVEANEPPDEGARREVLEELDLDVRVDRILVIDWNSPCDPWDDLLGFVFGGGILRDDQAGALRVRDSELKELAWCTKAEARSRLRPYAWRRLAWTGRARYLRDGAFLEHRSRAGWGEIRNR